ncbi:MAG: SMC-Scp complex subunit ScpB [Gammaproteobacteria bacterium]|nr:SMC-Scp complex subunit ScpB [Gammaproteobacteria bacterium]
MRIKQLNSFSVLDYKRIIEGAIMASDHPLSIEQITKIFDPDNTPSPQEIKQYLNTLIEDYQERGIELKEVATGYRFQVRQDLAPWIQKLWQERPAKYSRALLETLALIIYRQPITRAEIEDIRGVAVSTTIIKTLLDRDWVKILGYKEVPGKPALYATTKQFLDDFNLKTLSDLPPLSEIQNFEDIEAQMAVQLQLPVVNHGEKKSEMAEEEPTLESINE